MSKPGYRARSRRIGGYARWCAAALALGLLLQADAAATAREAGPAFPDAVAGFRRGPMTDYRSRNPGLGYSVHYGDARWKADVYVYDAGIAGIPDGPSSPAVEAQLAQAAGDIAKIVELGVYRDVVQRGRFSLPRKGPPRLACDDFAITQRDGRPSNSILCLTRLGGQFVKFRLTALDGRANQASAERFMQEWLRHQQGPARPAQPERRASR